MSHLFLHPDPDPAAMTGGSGAKALGAFYTDAQVADFLVWWAVRSPQDTVLDPSFGGGVFLRSACKRLTELGGRPAAQVSGVEVDAPVHARIVEKLGDEFGVPRQALVLADFFSLKPAAATLVDVVVGNPPFIRYHRFTGEGRRRALRCSLAEGVRLPELCSSWAPFLVHSVAMLRPGARLAMVVPMEVGHAQYALPVLEHLRRSFARVTFLTFRKKLFPDLSEDTLLLLAEDRGAAPGEFLCRDLPHAGLLDDLMRRGRRQLSGVRRLNAEGIAGGGERLVESFLPAKARELYRRLRRSDLVRRLGDLADVGIGYVTGANEFFHLAPEEAERRAIPRQFLRPAVRRGRALAGLRYTAEDWRRGVAGGQAGYLLYVEGERDLPRGVIEYLREGEARGVPRAYKCRTRSPWFRVPHVYLPDAFLSYMSGATPRLVANDAGAVAPNSLHILRLYPLAAVTGDALAALWQTSLTRLSAEIEGHSLGGGMLKIEPTEAERVVVPWPGGAGTTELGDLARDLDAAVRAAGEEAGRERADAVILREGLGLSRADCDLLRQAADGLRGRRYSRGASA